MVLKGAILRFRGSAFRRNTLTVPSISKGRSGTSGVMTGTGGFGVVLRRAGVLACLPPIDVVTCAFACRLQPNNPAPSRAASCKKLLRVPLITILQEIPNRRRH